MATVALALRTESLIPISAIPEPVVLAKFNQLGRPLLFPEQPAPASDHYGHPLGYYDVTTYPDVNPLRQLYIGARVNQKAAVRRQEWVKELDDTNAANASMKIAAEAQVAFYGLQSGMISRIGKAYSNLRARGIAPRLATYGISRFLHEQADELETTYTDDIHGFDQERRRLGGLSDAAVEYLADDLLDPRVPATIDVKRAAILAANKEQTTERQRDLALLNLEVVMAHAYNHALDKSLKKR
jgi:hypothetical protein